MSFSLAFLGVHHADPSSQPGHRRLGRHARCRHLLEAITGTGRAGQTGRRSRLQTQSPAEGEISCSGPGRNLSEQFVPKRGASFESVVEANQVVGKARLELCDTSAERVAVLERMLAQAKDLRTESLY